VKTLVAGIKRRHKVWTLVNDVWGGDALTGSKRKNYFSKLPMGMLFTTAVTFFMIFVIRPAFAIARELRKRDIISVALTPGFLRSERVLLSVLLPSILAPVRLCREM